MPQIVLSLHPRGTPLLPDGTPAIYVLLICSKDVVDLENKKALLLTFMYGGPAMGRTELIVVMISLRVFTLTSILSPRDSNDKTAVC